MTKLLQTLSFTDVTHSLGLRKENIGLENTLSKIVKNFGNLRSFNKKLKITHFCSR